MEHALRSVNHLSNFVLEDKKVLEQAGVKVAQRKIGFVKEKLGLEQQQFLEQYKNPKATLWTTDDNDLSVDPKVRVVMFNGLASNPGQLVRENSSMIHALCNELGVSAEQIQIVSISPPGFGDSGLKEPDIEKVRTREYKKLGKVWLDSLGSDPANTIIVGHSTGAETAMQFSEDGYEVFALNPSVHTGESAIFRNLDILNTASDKLRLSSLSLVKNIAQGITNGLVGIDGKTHKDQSDMHIVEESFNQKAFMYKCRELRERDELPGKPVKLPHFFYTLGDILTPASDAVEWYTQWIRKYWSDFRIEPEEAAKYVAQMVIPIDEQLSRRSGHDAIFVNPDVAKPFISRLATHIKYMMEKTPYVEKEAAPIVLPVTEKAAVRNEEQVRKLIYQGFTLESWAEVSRVITSKVDPLDSKVHLTPKDRKYISDLVFKHPVLQDYFADKKEEYEEFVKSPFMFFEKYYFSHSPLSDYFKFHLDWGTTFTNALRSNPATSSMIEGEDEHDNVVSNVLVGVKDGVALVTTLSTMDKSDQELILDPSDYQGLIKNQVPLQIFQEAVRQRLARIVAEAETSK